MLCSGLRKSDFENRGILGFNEYDNFGVPRVFSIEILTKIWSVDCNCMYKCTHIPFSADVCVCICAYIPYLN